MSVLFEEQQGCCIVDAWWIMLFYATGFYIKNTLNDLLARTFHMTTTYCFDYTWFVKKM